MGHSAGSEGVKSCHITLRRFKTFVLIRSLFIFKEGLPRAYEKHAALPNRTGGDVAVTLQA